MCFYFNNKIDINIDIKGTKDFLIKVKMLNKNYVLILKNHVLNVKWWLLN